MTKEHRVNSYSGWEDAPHMFSYSQHWLLTTTPTTRAQLYPHHLTSWLWVTLFYLNLLSYCELRNTVILFGPSPKNLPWPVWAHPNATADFVRKYKSRSRWFRNAFGPSSIVSSAIHRNWNGTTNIVNLSKIKISWKYVYLPEMLRRDRLDIHGDARLQFFFAKLPKIKTKTGVWFLSLLLIMEVLVFLNNQVTHPTISYHGVHM